jgi:hypothetical protein
MGVRVGDGRQVGSNITRRRRRGEKRKEKKRKEKQDKRMPNASIALEAIAIESLHRPSRLKELTHTVMFLDKRVENDRTLELRPRQGIDTLQPTPQRPNALDAIVTEPPDPLTWQPKQLRYIITLREPEPAPRGNADESRTEKTPQFYPKLFPFPP